MCLLGHHGVPPLGHVRPTAPAETEGIDRETFDKLLRTFTRRLGWEYLDFVKFAFCYKLETGEHIPEEWYRHLKPDPGRQESAGEYAGHPGTLQDYEYE